MVFLMVVDGPWLVRAAPPLAEPETRSQELHSLHREFSSLGSLRDLQGFRVPSF